MSRLKRETRETQIEVEIRQGDGAAEVATGDVFLDFLAKLQHGEIGVGQADVIGPTLHGFEVFERVQKRPATSRT